jgi:hypothetical protein
VSFETSAGAGSQRGSLPCQQPGLYPRDPRACPDDGGPHQRPGAMERMRTRVHDARTGVPAMPRGIGQVVARRSTVLSAMGSPNPPCSRNHGQGISAMVSRRARRTDQVRTPLNGRAAVGTGCGVHTLHAVDVSDHHPSARGLCPTITGARAPGRPLTRGHGRGTRPQDEGDRTIRAPIVPTGRHRSAPPRVQPIASGMPGVGRQVWVGPAGSRIGCAGGGWGRGPQPERRRVFANDAFEDGRPLDPELPCDEVKRDEPSSLKRNDVGCLRGGGGGNGGMAPV